MISVKYLARLRDVLGLAQENIHATDTAELLQSLRARGEVWDRELAENKA
ncbi:MAG: hypothetical protein RLZZ502_1312, partial [Pseudomonadota bacterium]